MQHFLFSLGTASLTISLLAAIYILVTPILRKRYSAKWCYYSWLIIIIGLIIPFRPQFDLPIMQITIPVSNKAQSEIAAPRDIESTELTAISNNFYQKQNQISGSEILGTIWIIGVIIMILNFLCRHIRFLRFIQRWKEDIDDPQIIRLFKQMKNSMGITSDIGLLQCACITHPIMIGLVRPVILLPAEKYSCDELTFILKHELTHIKRKDLVFKFLVITAKIIHWFNPFIYKIAREISLQCELSCDEAIMQNENIEIRKLYGLTILNAAKQVSKVQTILSTNFYGGQKDMKSRIFSILDTSRKKKGIFIICFIAFGMTATGMVFAAANPNEDISAYESNIPITRQEQTKLEEKRKQDIAEQYSIYNKYGLTYDSDKDRFYYKGNMVRFFTDTLDTEGNTNSFVHSDGIVDLKAIRNKQFVLTGIEAANQEEYDERTNAIQSAKKNSSDKIQENISENTNTIPGAASENTDRQYTGNSPVSSETGDPDYTDNSLSEYLDYGISYNKNTKQWLYGKKPIHYLTDGDNLTYLDNNEDSIKNGVLLKVIRSDDGSIKELTEINIIE